MAWNALSNESIRTNKQKIKHTKHEPKRKYNSITGGSSGIDFEMAKQLLSVKNKVIITGRNKEKLRQAKEELGGVTAIQCDAADSNSIKKLYDQIAKDFPELNLLINNAGVMLTINLQKHSLSAEELTKELDINVKGTIWMNDTFLPLLKKNKNAATVSVSSGLGFVPLPISPVYCATKVAVHSYTQSLRAQLKNTNVKVFELAPPATQTDLINNFDEEDMKGTKIMTVEAMVAQLFERIFKEPI